MEIRVLTPEESLEYYNQVKYENSLLTREQVQHWAQSLPKGMQGNTDYIIGADNWQRFYEYILTDEGYADWKETLDIVDYIKNWAIQNGETTEV
jgi:hypothetical protein